MREFDPRQYTQDLRLPPGLRYVHGHKVEDILATLQEGLGVYMESGEGPAGRWRSRRCP